MHLFAFTSIADYVTKEDTDEKKRRRKKTEKEPGNILSRILSWISLFLKVVDSTLVE